MLCKYLLFKFNIISSAYLAPSSRYYIVIFHMLTQMDFLFSFIITMLISIKNLTYLQFQRTVSFLHFIAYMNKYLLHLLLQFRVYNCETNLSHLKLYTLNSNQRQTAYRTMRPPKAHTPCFMYINNMFIQCCLPFAKTRPTMFCTLGPFLGNLKPHPTPTSFHLPRNIFAITVTRKQHIYNAC